MKGDLVMARTATKSSEAAVAPVKTTGATELAKEESMIVKEAKTEKLLDNEAIAIESLIPNVSYLDSKTGDMYEWENAGDIVYMTMEVLKNMWRTHKGYFRNLWLKPVDDRVIKHLGMAKVFEKYEALMKATSYTRESIGKVLDEISSAPNSLKSSIINRIIAMVSEGELTDVRVVRDIEKRFDLDLISLL